MHTGMWVSIHEGEAVAVGGWKATIWPWAAWGPSSSTRCN